MAGIDTSIAKSLVDSSSTPKRRIYLTKEQINEICDCFKIPFNGIDLVLEEYNQMLRELAVSFLEPVKIYDGMFEEYKEHLRKKYLQSLQDADTPIGANTSDAIGAQATQALLNTFHSVGTLKSGGPDGINENISISSKRQILYSMIHMTNGYLSYSDVMNMKKEFIGLSVKNLLSSEPIPYIVNIGEELKLNPFDTNLSPEQRKKIMLGPSNWWYNLVPFEGVYDRTQSGSVSRTCIRLNFDVQKLYDYNFLLSEIAYFISKWKFEIKASKRNSESKKKHDNIEVEVVAVPSPTIKGVIDIFIKSYDELKDHILISLIHDNEFNNLLVSGIQGLTNFYAVPSVVTNLIRDIEETSRFDEEGGIKGTWLYLKNNRFSGVPYFRLVELLEAAGLKIEIPYYNVPDSYRKNYTTFPFDYHSHKYKADLRSKMKVRGYIFGSMTEHEHPHTYVIGVSGNLEKVNCDIKHYTYTKLNTGFEIGMYQYGEVNDLSFELLCNKKFKTRSSLVKYINQINNRLSKQEFVKRFGKPNPDVVEFYKNPKQEYKTVGFEIEEHGSSPKYVVYYLFKLHYIEYQLNVNLDYVNSRFVTMSLDSVINKHFSIPYDIANPGGQSLPDVFRIPRIYDVEKINPLERRILLKTKMFFTDKYDFIGNPDRENLLKTKPLKPFERLIQYVNSHTTKDQQTYVYAEASGANLLELLKKTNLKTSSIFCNDFHQTWNCLGHECLRNLLCYDMINMINSQGYVSVSYMNFAADVITHNGINAMTSEGISCQNRDYLAMISFDNAFKYVMKAASTGKYKHVNSTSSSIGLGQLFKLGTGAVEIGIDKAKINMNHTNSGISRGFLELIGVEKPVSQLFLPDGSDDPIFLPNLIVGRMKQVPWIIDTFIEKDLLFYIQTGIDNTRRLMFTKFDKFDSNDELLIQDDDGFRRPLRTTAARE